MRIPVLDRKLLRDLLGMKGQALAIGMVLGAGVAMYVTYLSNFDSLRRTQDAYYDRFRFASVFASCKRAPLRLEERLREIPGVAAAHTRVVVDVTLDVPGVTEPIKGRLISVPADRRPPLNDLYLRRGRWIEPGQGDEVLLNEAFALAHRLEPGDRFAALINGRRQVLRVAGHALSPEYVYVLPPGEVIPDDGRFGVAWMERRALASAFDMEGAFNDVALKVAPGASEAEVVARLDRLLRPWGGLGAVPRRLQTSHWALDNELKQLQSFGFLVPAIFLGVAAFLLNVAMARTLSVQRPQIAALKALGYSNSAIGWHYVKWGLVIAIFGAALGIGAGTWLGSAMIGLYNQYFRFPILLYRLSGGVAVTALGIGLAAAALGAVFAVSRAIRIPPAEAMRPEPPARYHTSLVERPALQSRLTHATRMVLRNLERQPWRAFASVTGIAFAVGILFFGFIFIDVMERLAEFQFTQVQRQDVTVSFVEPRSSGALHEIAGLPGVMATEPVRTVPARLRFGHRSRQLAIIGQVAAPDLNRVVDLAGHVITLPPSGLVISKILGEILGVKPGDRITVEVLEGARPVREVEVAALVDDTMGLAAFMERGALNRLLREGPSLSGAHLMVDSARLDALYRRLKATPAVAGISLTAAALASFRAIMAQNFTIITTFNVAFAVIIAFGVVYNAARISLSERSRELASLRVLGFTIGEISLILLGELALLTVAAIPPGLLIGWALAEFLLMSFQNEFYRLPLLITPQNAAWSALTVILAAALSGLAVRRRLDHLDLVAVLKTRE
ncbi:MAG TPA: ABC transporter permease [Vicinamibacteria bacterium]